MPEQVGELVSGEAQPDSAKPGKRVLRDLNELAKPLAIKVDPHARILVNELPAMVMERYRRLRTRLLQDDAAGAIRTVAVTSAEPEEGKTLTSLNLALSFGLLPGFRAVVVDGDLRRGTIAHWFGVKSDVGLSNVLSGTANLEDAILKIDGFPIHVVLAGACTEPAAELLQPGRLQPVIDRLHEYFDLVIVDTPPVNLVADANLIADCCDGVLVVARAYVTKRKALEKALSDLAGHRILGAVLNAGADHRDYRGYQNYY